MIYVCGITRVHEVQKIARANWVVSLIDPGTEAPEICAEHKLVLYFHDVTGTKGDRLLVKRGSREPASGWIPPDRAAMKLVCGFGRRWVAAKDDLLVHCHKGSSRSAAAALIFLAMATKSPDQAALLLRTHGPKLNPNRLMVALADPILEMDGDLVAAFDGMKPRMHAVRIPVP